MRTLIYAVVLTSGFAAAMSRSSQQSEHSSNSPKRMLNEFLRKSDNCLKELSRGNRSKESSPIRPHISVQNLDKHAVSATFALPENSSPRENELSSSPKKLITSLLGRSNSRKHLLNPKTTKENSTQGSPRSATAGTDESISVLDEMDPLCLQNHAHTENLKKFLRNKMTEDIAMINAGKVAPLPADTRNKKASCNFSGDPFAKHYLFTHEYKDTPCILHFIECTASDKLLCFINYPLLYES